MGTVGVAIGFVIMMILDVELGFIVKLDKKQIRW